ncbi:ead/Ea22-like family protein [Citrobacter portucalensis]|uniref:ead/Ea22-like family protein n=1 Tax=Citrobacter portucalensis TaxID=1639133 RepID=UPI0024335107|nr:ead/Ea22-like family protein [Citrobacter portucalensis]WFZ31212.1 ead/Ea22-like family protein [Citrobacter portucalensis]WFZ36213.1 ead/Ea22-like family protein [Citrobacter portucalensis]
MKALNKQALREAANAANIASWGKWESYKPHKGARGYEVKVGAKAVAQHCLKVDSEFIAATNPTTVLSLLDELEAANELVELQRFKLERQAEDLHQAKSLESIHRDKRFEVEREFRDYKDRAESNQMRLAKEVCRLEDELQAAGIGVKGD